MAGHSKSSNIKHRKNAQDTKRSRLFTKLTREIIVAARDNPDFSQNARLRLARERALAANLKKETIEKAIKKATEPNEVSMETVRYEGYGPLGTAILVDTLTDNRNRTASNVRYLLNRQEINLGSTGSVIWSFYHKGVIRLSKRFNSEPELMELALAVGAEDLIFSQTHAFSSKLITARENLEGVINQLEQASTSIEVAVLAWLPKNRVLLEDSRVLAKIQNCIESLEALPEVEAVYTSCDWQLE